VSDTSRSASSICTICYKKACWEEWALSTVGVEEGREFRFRGDLYSQECTFPLVSRAFAVVYAACSGRLKDLVRSVPSLLPLALSAACGAVTNGNTSNLLQMLYNRLNPLITVTLIDTNQFPCEYTLCNQFTLHT